MIPLPLQGRSIGLSENGRDFRGFEIADSPPRRSLEWDTAHFGALLRGKRLVCSDNSEEAPQCRQPAVSSADGCLVFLFEILEKGQNLNFAVPVSFLSQLLDRTPSILRIDDWERARRQRKSKEDWLWMP